MADERIDHYRVLQVWPDVDQQAIDAAYQRLLEAAGDDADRRRQFDEAYAVLGDPERRAEYERERETAAAAEPPPTPSAPEEPAPPAPEAGGAPAVPPPQHGGTNRALFAAMLGVVFLALAVSAALVGWALSRDDDSSDYPLTRADDEYDLEGMQLRNVDLPIGLQRVEGQGFDNNEWALLLSPDDPDSALRQLEAQGRIRNHIAFFTWDNPIEHLGETISVTTQSTLYVDEATARESLRGLCGMLLDERSPIVEFDVPRLGDESTGFQVRQPNQTFGTTLETVICFRTGRVVHAVSQAGLQGADDLALSVRLAQRMLRRVDDAFAGRSAPLDETPPSGG